MLTPSETVEAGFELHQHVARKHEARRRLKRRLLHALTLVMVIIVTTLLFNLVQRTSAKYHPHISEPKDFARELQELHGKH